MVTKTYKILMSNVTLALSNFPKSKANNSEFFTFCFHSYIRTNHTVTAAPWNVQVHITIVHNKTFKVYSDRGIIVNCMEVYGASQVKYTFLFNNTKIHNVTSLSVKGIFMKKLLNFWVIPIFISARDN